MPKQYEKYCENCPYHPNNGHAPSNGITHLGPLAIEQNSKKVLLIFQAPGRDEWVEKKPICSKNKRSTSARINNALKRIGRTRLDFSITNSTQCYPGKLSSGRDKKPCKSAYTCCSNWLKKDIDSTNYKKIIVFGSIAKKSIEYIGYENDTRFIFIKHPSGGLTNTDLDHSLKF